MPTGSCLVVLATTIDLTHGGGQRTWSIFKTLQALGPVTVVILGNADREKAEETFAGANTIAIWPEFGLTPAGGKGLSRASAFLARSFAPAKTYRADPRLRARLKALLQAEKVDLVLFRLFLAYATSGLHEDPASAPPMIVDIDDRDDQKARTRVRSLFGPLLAGLVFDPLAIAPLRRLMVSRLRAAARIWFVSETDRAPIFGERTDLVENAPMLAPPEGAREGAAARKRMMFVGSSYFPPNRHGMQWFLRECWPLIVRKAPDARLAIVGEGDWHAIAAEAPAAANIDILGKVADLAAEYEASRFTICPIEEGGGSKIKLIESCSFGRPVVATPHSCRGYAPDLARDLVVGKTAEQFAEGCIRLLTDDALVAATGQRLRAAQQRFHSAEALQQKMADSIETALNARVRTADGAVSTGNGAA